MRRLVFKNINLPFIHSIRKRTQNTFGIARPITLQEINWLNKVQDLIPVLFVCKIYSSKGIQSEFCVQKLLGLILFHSLLFSYVTNLIYIYVHLFLFELSFSSLSSLLILFCFLNIWNIKMVQKSKLYFKSILRDVSFPFTHCHLRKGRWHLLGTI